MTWTVRRLIDGGWCSTRCLTATGRQTACHCACGGRWHALLSGHHVPPPVVSRPPPVGQLALFDPADLESGSRPSARPSRRSDPPSAQLGDGAEPDDHIR